MTDSFSLFSKMQSADFSANFISWFCIFLLYVQIEAVVSSSLNRMMVSFSYLLNLIFSPLLDRGEHSTMTMVFVSAW